MNKTATALIICFILLSSILTIGIFPKIDFLPVLAKESSSASAASSNAGTTPPSGGGTTPPSGGGTTPPSGGGTTPPSGGGTTPPSGGQSPSIGTSKVPAEATPPVVDCTATPHDPSCPPPPKEENNTSSSAQTAAPPLVPTHVPTTQRNGPDSSCTFFPELPHCVPDPKTGLCPPGFSMNEDGHCFRSGKCPTGFERRDDDESGTCWPTDKNSPPILCPPGVNPPNCVNQCPKGTHPDDLKLCVKNKVIVIHKTTPKIIHVIHITSNNDQNSMVTRNTQLTDQLTVGQAINECKDIIANSPNIELKKSCNIFMAAIFNYCLTHTRIANKDSNICSDDLYLTNVPQYVKENVSLNEFPPTIYNIRP
jgi:hypothetical protein